MERIDLQEILDKAGGKPFIYMPEASARLALRVDKPDEWQVASASRFSVDLLSGQEMNPGGLLVTTNAMASLHGFTAPHVLSYGIAQLGAKTRFAELLRRTRALRDGKSATVISSALPRADQMWWLSWALGMERSLFGSYNHWLDRFCVTRQFRMGRAPAVVGMKKERLHELEEVSRRMAYIDEGDPND